MQSSMSLATLQPDDSILKSQELRVQGLLHMMIRGLPGELLTLTFFRVSSTAIFTA